MRAVNTHAVNKCWLHLRRRHIRRDDVKLSQEKAYRIMLKGYPDVLDIKQMCEILGISLKTGYGLIQENKIECLKVGRAYKIPKPFLFSYLRIGTSSDSEQ